VDLPQKIINFGLGRVLVHCAQRQRSVQREEVELFLLHLHTQTNNEKNRMITITKLAIIHDPCNPLKVVISNMHVVSNKLSDTDMLNRHFNLLKKLLTWFYSNGNPNIWTTFRSRPHKRRHLPERTSRLTDCNFMIRTSYVVNVACCICICIEMRSAISLLND